MSEKKENMEEVQRRQTVAQLHKAGTEIRKEELERIKMSAKILLGRAENIYESIKDKDNELVKFLKGLEKINKAKTKKERDMKFLSEVIELSEDDQTLIIIQREVDGLVRATNDIITQLENQGVYFSFPKFESYQGISACKFSLEGIIGFLRGLKEA